MPNPAPSLKKTSPAHDKAWEQNFVVPIAKTMKQKGVAYLVIVIRDTGKTSYVLDTQIPPNADVLAPAGEKTPTKQENE